MKFCLHEAVPLPPPHTHACALKIKVNKVDQLYTCISHFLQPEIHKFWNYMSVKD